MDQPEQGFHLGLQGREVEMAGELDVSSAPRARAVFAELIDAGPEQVVIEVGRLTFCDSTGIGALIGLAQGLPRGRVVIRHANRRLRSLLELVGVATVFTFEPAEDPDAAEGVEQP